MLPLNARELTDLQWAILDALIPEPPRRNDGRGRPWKARRSVLNGILWVLRTGAPWVIPLTRRAIVDFSNGCGQESCEASWKHKPKICRFEVGWMSVKPSSTAAVRRPKRGIEGRQNETW
jgi:Putative transposase of IS4/5 family (DUF4096)